MDSVLMLDADLPQRVIRFVASSTGLQAGDIAARSRLLHDLGIDGDDAAELIDEYASVFEVDMAGFEFSKHFRGEAGIMFTRLDKLLPVTVEDLVESASRHRWIGLSG